MPAKKKNVRADVSETGVVLPCPLCEQRTWSTDSRLAWRWLYRHLSDHHGQIGAAKIAESARRQAQKNSR